MQDTDIVLPAGQILLLQPLMVFVPSTHIPEMQSAQASERPPWGVASL